MTPAFVDAHVHATDTGITLHGLDLAGTRVARRRCSTRWPRTPTLPADAVVLGHGWDESGWAEQRPPDAAELDRAGGGRPVYLTRVDMHSAIVLAALLVAEAAARRRATTRRGGCAATPTTGSRRRRWVRWRQAAAAAPRSGDAAARGVAGDRRGPRVRRAGHRPARTTSPALLALSAEGGLPEVYGYWGELGAAAKARELGAIGAGGDLFADGALGSHTAHLRQSYVDAGSAAGTGT